MILLLVLAHYCEPYIRFVLGVNFMFALVGIILAIFVLIFKGHRFEKSFPVCVEGGRAWRVR